MKILHTSDWHIGKRPADSTAWPSSTTCWARSRRSPIGTRSTWCWSRATSGTGPIPQMDAFALGLETLLRLADRRPVVVVAGNHDSADLFEALAPLLRPRGCT